MTEAIDKIVSARPEGPKSEHDVIQGLLHPVQDVIGIMFFAILHPFHHQASSRHP